MNYLLDTNVLSEWSKPQPQANVIAWLKTCEQLTISGMTLLEIRYGLLLAKSAYKEKWFRLVLPALTILDAWSSLFDEASDLLEHCKRKGTSPSPADVVIAAYARRYQHVLATRNIKDFRHCGVEVFNPFEA